MKRISFIISGLRGGGAEKVCVTLANKLVEKGYEIDLVVLSLKGGVNQKYLSKKVNLVDLSVYNARKSLKAIYLYCKGSNPSLFLSFNRQISVVLVILRAIFDLRYKIVSRNIIHLSSAEKEKKGLWHGYIVNKAIKFIYPKSDYLVAQSKAMAEDLIEYLGVHPNKVVVINNPISERVSREVDAKLCNKRYVLCVGRLEKQKAFELAIHAFSKVNSRVNDLKLLIVGEGTERTGLEELVKKLELNGFVEFLGYSENVTQLYECAEITLLTSKYEGFPNVLVESIQSGTPVVSVDCPTGPSEIIINGVNGYLVPQSNVEELSYKIESAISDKWDKEKIIETSKRYDSDVIANQYEELFNRVWRRL